MISATAEALENAFRDEHWRGELKKRIAETEAEIATIEPLLREAERRYAEALKDNEALRRVLALSEQAESEAGNLEGD